MISIIIPIYNAEHYLRPCLDSVLKQTYTDIQAICVDDGSTDRSPEIIEEYSRRDARILVIHQSNKGLSAARNAGLEQATGEQIMFLDADDWLDERTCEQALGLMRQHEAEVVLWGYNKEYGSHHQCVRVWPNVRVFEGANIKYLHRRLIGLIGRELGHLELLDSLGTAWGKLYRRSLFMDHQVRYIDIKEIGSAEDVLANIELFSYVRKAVYTPFIIHHYRKDNMASLTKSYKPNLERQWLSLFEKIQTILFKYQMDQEAFQALANRKSLAIVGLGLNIFSDHVSFFTAWGKIRNLLAKTWYRKSVATLPLRHFPIHWKIFFFCAKKRMALGICLLIIAIKRHLSA